MWRPKGWLSSPCDNCPSKVEDSYGLFCDISCGKATAYANQEAGADAMLESLFKLAKESPTGTFVIDSTVINVFEAGETEPLNTI